MPKEGRVDVTGDELWNLGWLNFIVYWVWTLIRVLIDPFLPRSWFNPDRWPYRLADWEDGGEFYRRALHIERWKDHLPAFAGGTRFDKKHLAARDPQYLSRFITETCRGESNHLRAIGSVVVMRLWTPLALWLVLLMIAALGNLPFIAIQRYNRPRLQRALALRERQAQLGHYGDEGLQPA